MLKRLFTLVLAGATLTACVTIGTKFDIRKADQLTPQVSTADDAIALLGNPTSDSNINGTNRLLQWQYSQGTMVGGNGAHLAILFDKDGKMIRITNKTKI